MKKNKKTTHKVRILFLIGELGYGGSERQLYLLLKHLDKSCFEAHVLVFNHSAINMQDKLQQEGINVVFLPKSCSGISRRSRYIYEFTRRLGPDIIHSWTIHDNPFAGLVGRVAGVPIRIGSVRGSINLPGFNNLPRLLRWLSLNSVSILTVNARSIAEELRQIGYPGGQIAILPNCVEILPPLPTPDLNDFGINNQQPLIGTVGNLRLVKNQALFIDALGIVLARFPDVRAVIVGQPIPSEEALQAQLQGRIAALGLCDRVHLLGFRPDVPALMQRFSIFCLTSDSEGTPNTVLEAMAASRPVVASRIGGVPEIVEDGVHGYLVKPGDVAATAHALRKLLEDPGLAHHMGQTGQSRVARDFNPKQVSQQWANFFLNALQAKDLDMNPHRASLI